MSLSEISTLLSRKLNPIIILLNNGGYTTERYLLDGTFNDIHNWNYHLLPQMFNGGRGALVTTEDELELEITAALSSKELTLLNVIVDPKDVSPALRRMTEKLSKRVISLDK